MPDISVSRKGVKLGVPVFQSAVYVIDFTYFTLANQKYTSHALKLRVYKGPCNQKEKIILTKRIACVLQVKISR